MNPNDDLIKQYAGNRTRRKDKSQRKAPARAPITNPIGFPEQFPNQIPQFPQSYQSQPTQPQHFPPGFSQPQQTHFNQFAPEPNQYRPPPQAAPMPSIATWKQPPPVDSIPVQAVDPEIAEKITRLQSSNEELQKQIELHQSKINFLQKQMGVFVEKLLRIEQYDIPIRPESYDDDDM